MSSPLSKFNYGIFGVAKNSRETIMRVGHALGSLAAVRRDYLCPSCETEHEAWSVIIIRKKKYIFPIPHFFNIDDAANFILSIIDLQDWEADVKLSEALSLQLTLACVEHGGFPLSLVEAAIADGLQLKHPKEPH